MSKKFLFIFIFFAILMSFVSCTSTHSDNIVVIGDDDLIGDVSKGNSFVGAAINNVGEWVSAGSLGIGYGDGSKADFSFIPMGTGSTDADHIVDINDNGMYVAAFSDGFYVGNLNGSLTKVLEGDLGYFLSAKINNNDIWIVSFEGGVYIGYGLNEPTSLDFASNIGAFSHVSVNDNDEFVIAGDIQVLYGYVDNAGLVNLFSYDPVSVYSDSVWTDMNDFGEFIATGSLDTILALNSTNKKADYNFLNKRASKSFKEVNTNTEIRKIDVSKFEKKGKLKVKFNYKPFYLNKGEQKVYKKVATSYHSCAINSDGSYGACGHDYMVVNDVNYTPVTDPFEMTVIDINDSGTWIVVGTEGLYYNGNFIYDVMGSGDFVSMKLDNTGNFICATSYSVFSYRYQTDDLVDNGPVADRGFPVYADISGYKWVTAGNYGVLLWNY